MCPDCRGARHELLERDYEIAPLAADPAHSDDELAEGWGKRRREEEAEGEGAAPFLRSRDRQLAGGEYLHFRWACGGKTQN